MSLTAGTCMKSFVAFLIGVAQWILVIPIFFLPISAAWNYISMKIETGLETNHKKHKNSVAGIQYQVKQWIGRSSKNKDQKMATARPGWKSVSPVKADKSKYFLISINLNQILELDEDKKTVTVEPGVMMGQISRYLFKRGWTIPVVPELDTLSIGGLICGAGLETSSHKYGLFCNTAISYEIVLPTSDVVTCSKENDPDLFYSIPGSYGTIAFLTAITIPLLSSKRYVKHEYRRVSSIPEFRNMLEKEPNHDFIEGFAFSKNQFVVMFGDMDDGVQNPGEAIKINHINRWYKQPFYKQVETILTSRLHCAPSFMEYIPLIDYYHRHSRGIFWELPKTFPLVNSHILLFLLGWAFPLHTHAQVLVPRSLFNHFRQGQVIQDYVVPMENAETIFEAGDQLLKIYPVWLCPTRVYKTPSMFRSSGDGDYLDIGFYFYPQAKGFHPVSTMKALEQLTIDNIGFQGLYADCYMSKDQFREMFDTTTYDKVRRERGLESAFPDVYEKVGPKARNLEELKFNENLFIPDFKI